jgi:cytoskeletal protein CcmA (bactofilin family)
MKFRPSILPQGVRLVGNVAGDEDLVVFGTVEGEVDVGGTIIVEESGVVRGNVHGRTVSVRGIVIGDASGVESVRVEAGGSMVGDVHAPRVNIVKGAKFRGHVHMTGSDDAAGDVRSVARRARPPVERERPAAELVETPIELPRAARERPSAELVETPTELPRAARERPSAELVETPIELPRAARGRPAAEARERPSERRERSGERSIEVEDRSQSRPRRHRRRFAVEPKTTPGTVPADRADTLAGTLFSPPSESAPEAPKPARSGPPLPVFPAVGRVRAQRRDGEKATDH